MPSVPAASGLVKPFRSFPGRGAAQSREPGTSRGMRNENQCPGRKMGLPRAGSRARGSCGRCWPLPPPWPVPGTGALTHRQPGRHAGPPRGTGSRSRAPEQPRYLPGGRLRAVSSPGLPDVRQDGCDLPGRPGTMGPGGPRRAWPRRSGHHQARLPGVPSLQRARPAAGSETRTALTLRDSGRPPVPLIRPGNAGRRGQRLPAGPATGSRRRCRARRGGGCGAGSSRRPRAGRWSCPCPARSRPGGSRR